MDAVLRPLNINSFMCKGYVSILVVMDAVLRLIRVR